MRCVTCGTEMHLVQVVEDDTKMVTGYEHHTLECSGCCEIERRLVFNQSRKSRTRRNVQVVHDPSYEAAYSAKDTTSSMVVMRHRRRRPDTASHVTHRPQLRMWAHYSPARLRS
jgi:hypothetical protein